MKSRAPLLDLLFVLLFIAIGRRSHQHGVTWSGMASTSWPFVAGLVVGWFVIWRSHRTGESPREGILIALTTVAIGMVLRVVAGQGTALAFIIVAVAFLCLFFVGWRLALRLLTATR